MGIRLHYVITLRFESLQIHHLLVWNRGTAMSLRELRVKKVDVKAVTVQAVQVYGRWQYGSTLSLTTRCMEVSC
jgi:hypothetical protein